LSVSLIQSSNITKYFDAFSFLLLYAAASSKVIQDHCITDSGHLDNELNEGFQNYGLPSVHRELILKFPIERFAASKIKMYYLR
jgi:hypothetical protein